MATAATPTKVVTGKVRLSYCHLFEPFSSFEGQDAKYSVVILVPKSDTVTVNKIKAAQQAALEAGKSTKFGGSIPKNWKNTFRDGDEEGDLDKNPEYAGHYFMTISNKTKPGVVDQQVNPVLDQTEVYSGCYARVSMNAFAFSASGNKGVSFGLNHVQKLADGEPFGSFSKAENDFDAVEDLEESLI
jgi:hypothetical protein